MYYPRVDQAYTRDIGDVRSKLDHSRPRQRVEGLLTQNIDLRWTANSLRNHADCHACRGVDNRACRTPQKKVFYGTTTPAYDEGLVSTGLCFGENALGNHVDRFRDRFGFDLVWADARCRKFLDGPIKERFEDVFLIGQPLFDNDLPRCLLLFRKKMAIVPKLRGQSQQDMEESDLKVIDTHKLLADIVNGFPGPFRIIDSNQHFFHLTPPETGSTWLVDKTLQAFCGHYFSISNELASASLFPQMYIIEAPTFQDALKAVHTSLSLELHF